MLIAVADMRGAHPRHRAPTLIGEDQMRIARSGPVLAAALALSVIAVTGARATEGPYIKVEGKSLKSGESQEFKSTVKESFVLETKALGVKITCPGWPWLKFLILENPLGGIFIDIGGWSWKSCVLVGNGEKCGVENKEINSNTLKGALGYANASRTGPILALFEPVTGKVIATVKFTPEAGGACNTASTSLTGTVIGGAFIAGKALEVGHEVETLKTEFHFAGTSKAIWIESTSKTLKETKSKLELSGLSSLVVGEVALETVTGVKWGIFT